MKVIGAGMSKTGTKSLNDALTQLGFKVYDHLENSFLLQEEFSKIVNEGWTTEDFRRMYEDVDAVVDNPAYIFWEEISKAFPEAKIILTVRDSEEEWFRSLRKQTEATRKSFFLVIAEIFSPTYSRMISQFGKELRLTPVTLLPIKLKINREMLKMKYRAHNAYVMQMAPKDKLLVFNCKDGWGPLCKFLQVPVPDQPFPHKNKTGDVVGELMKHDPILRRIAKEAYLGFGIFLCSAAISSIMIYRIGPAKIGKFFLKY